MADKNNPFVEDIDTNDAPPVIDISGSLTSFTGTRNVEGVDPKLFRDLGVGKENYLFPIHNPEKFYDIMAEEQTAAQQRKYALNQFLTGAGAGALSSLAGWGHLLGFENTWADKLADDLLEMNADYTIYSNSNSIFDRGNFLQLLGGMGTTMGIVGEAAIETLLISAATAGLGSGAAVANAASKIKNGLSAVKALRALNTTRAGRAAIGLGKTVFSKGTLMGVRSGLGETDMNARQTYDSVYEQAKAAGLSDEIAEQAAQKAYDQDFNSEIWTNLLIDGFVFSGLNYFKSFKGAAKATKKGATLGQKVADNAASKMQITGTTSDLIETGFDMLTSKIKNPVLRHGANVLTSMTAEGVEEATQGAIQRAATFNALESINDQTETDLNEEYLDAWDAALDTDQMVMEAAGGALGGLFFGGVGTANSIIGRNRARKYQETVAKKLDDNNKKAEERRADLDNRDKEIDGEISQLEERKAQLQSDETPDGDSSPEPSSYTLAQDDGDAFGSDGGSVSGLSSSDDDSLPFHISQKEREEEIKKIDARLVELGKEKASIQKRMEANKQNQRLNTFMTTVQLDLQGHNGDNNPTTEHEEEFKHKLSRVIDFAKNKDIDGLKAMGYTQINENSTEADYDAIAQDARETLTQFDEYKTFLTDHYEEFTSKSLLGATDVYRQSRLLADSDAALLNNIDAFSNEFMQSSENMSEEDKQLARYMMFDAINSDLFRSTLKEDSTITSKLAKSFNNIFDRLGMDRVSTRDISNIINGKTPQKFFNDDQELMKKLDKGLNEKIKNPMFGKAYQSLSAVIEQSNITDYVREGLNETVRMVESGNYNLYQTVNTLIDPQSGTLSKAAIENTTKKQLKQYEKTLKEARNKKVISNDEFELAEKKINRLRDQYKNNDNKVNDDETKLLTADDQIDRVRAKKRELAELREKIENGDTGLFDDIRERIRKDRSKDHSDIQITEDGQKRGFYRDNDGRVFMIDYNTKEVFTEQDGEYIPVKGSRKSDYMIEMDSRLERSRSKESTDTTAYENAIYNLYDIFDLRDSKIREEQLEQAIRLDEENKEHTEPVVTATAKDTPKGSKTETKPEEKDPELITVEVKETVEPENPETGEPAVTETHTETFVKKEETEEEQENKATETESDTSLQFHFSNSKKLASDEHDRAVSIIVQLSDDHKKTTGKDLTFRELIQTAKDVFEQDNAETAQSRLDNFFGYARTVWKDFYPDTSEIELARVYTQLVRTEDPTTLLLEYEEDSEVSDKKKKKKKKKNKPEPPQENVEKMTIDEYQERVISKLSYHDGNTSEHRHLNISPELSASYRSIGDRIDDPSVIFQSDDRAIVDFNVDPATFEYDNDRGLHSEKLISGQVKVKDEFTLRIPENADEQTIYYYKLTTNKDGEESVELITTTWKKFKEGDNILGRAIDESDTLFWRYVPLYAYDQSDVAVFSIATESYFENPNAIGLHTNDSMTDEKKAEQDEKRLSVQKEGMQNLYRIRMEAAYNNIKNQKTTVLITGYDSGSGYVYSKYDGSNQKYSRLRNARSGSNPRIGYIDAEGGIHDSNGNAVPLVYKNYVSAHMTNGPTSGLQVEIADGPYPGEYVILPVENGFLPSTDEGLEINNENLGTIREYIKQSLLGNIESNDRASVGIPMFSQLSQLLTELNPTDSTGLENKYAPSINVTRKTTVIQLFTDRQGTTTLRLNYFDPEVVDKNNPNGPKKKVMYVIDVTFDAGGNQPKFEVRSVIGPNRQGRYSIEDNTRNNVVSHKASRNQIENLIDTALDHFTVSPYMVRKNSRTSKNTPITDKDSRKIKYTLNGTPYEFSTLDVLQTVSMTAFVSSPVDVPVEVTDSDGTVRTETVTKDVVLFQPKVGIRSAAEKADDGKSIEDKIKDVLSELDNDEVSVQKPKSSAAQAEDDATDPTKTNDNKVKEEPKPEPKPESGGGSSSNGNKGLDDPKELLKEVNGMLSFLVSPSDNQFHISRNNDLLEARISYLDEMNFSQSKMRKEIADYIFNFTVNILKNKAESSKNWKGRVISEVKNLVESKHKPLTEMLAKIDSMPDSDDPETQATIQELRSKKHDIKEITDYTSSILEDQNDAIINELCDEAATQISILFGYTSVTDDGFTDVETLADEQLIDTETNTDVSSEDLSDGIEDKTNERIYAKESFEENRKNNTNKNVKLFLSGVEKEGVKTFFGAKQYYKFDELYDAISTALITDGTFTGDFNDLVRIVSEQYTRTNDDRLGAALKQLEGLNDQQLKNAIATEFQGYYLKFDFILEGKNGDRRIRTANLNDAKFDLTKEILDSVKNRQVAIKNGRINRDELVKNGNEVKNLINEFATLSSGDERFEGKENEITDKLYEFATSVGLNIKKETIRTIVHEKQFVRNSGGKAEATSIKELFNPKKSVFGVILEKLDPNKEIDTSKSWLDDSRGLLSSLVDLDLAYRLGGVTKMVYDNGKLIYTFATNNYVSNRTRYITTHKKDFAEKHPHSSWMQELASSEEGSTNKFGEEFSLRECSITPYRQDGKVAKIQGTQLNDVDQEAMRFSFMQDQRTTKLTSETYDTETYEVVKNLTDDEYDKRMETAQEQHLKAPYVTLDRRVGTFVLPTVSDKSRIFLIKGIKYEFQRISDDYSLMTDIATELIFNNTVLPELDRMIAASSRKDDKWNWLDVDASAQLFLAFPFLNNLVTNNGEPYFQALVNEYKKGDSGSYDTLLSEFKTAAKNSIAKQIEDEIDYKLNNSPLWKRVVDNSYDSVLNKSDYVESIAGRDNIARIAAFDYIANNYIAQGNIFTIYNLDPFQFATPKFAVKLEEAIKEVENDEKKTWEEDIDFVELVNKYINTNHNKRMSGLSASGKQIASQVSPRYLEIFAKDRIAAASNLSFLIETFVEDKKTKAKALEWYETYKSLEDDSENQQNAAEELIKLCPQIKDYIEFKTTDAQEYTTTREHIDVLYGKGEISEENYNTIVDKLEAQYEDEANGGSVKSEHLLTQEELKMVLQPMKPVYFDSVTDSSSGLERMVYIKTSSIPLLPQMTAGTPLDNVRRAMEKIEHDYIKDHGDTPIKPNRGNKEDKTIGVRLTYNSGIKVGAPSRENQLNLWTSSGRKTNTDIESLTTQMLNASMMLDRSGFKIQQEIPTHDKEEIHIPTQLEKLILGSGVGQIKEKIFNLNGKEVSGVELLKKYNVVLDEINRKHLKKFCEEFGITEDGYLEDDSSEGLRKFYEELSSLLIEEAKKRNYPQQDIDALQIVERKINNGKGETVTTYGFAMPLWCTTQSAKFESLLHSVFNNRLIKYKLPGYSAVCTTSTGWFKDSKNKTTIDQIVYTKHAEGWDGVLRGARYETVGDKSVFKPAQIMLPAKFRDSEGNLIKLIEDDGTYNKAYVTNVNGKLKLNYERISDELTDIVGLRIPTSSHVSMSAFEIIGFLPPSAGDICILPDNLNVQMGLDYDIDKMYFMQPASITTKDGDIIKYKRKDGEQRLDEKAACTDLYDIVHTILSCDHPFVQSRVSNVLSMEHASQTAEIIAAAEKESKGSKLILSDEHQKKNVMLGSSGKTGVGVYSNALVYASMLQQLTDYHYSTTYTSGFVFAKPEFNEPGYTVDELRVGNFTLSDVCSTAKLNGKRTLSEAFAEKQNTATDNAKENILGRANVTVSDMNIDSFLLMMGVDLDTVKIDGKDVDLNWSYLLFSQPAVKAYKEQKALSRSVSRGVLYREEQQDNDEPLEFTATDLDVLDKRSEEREEKLETTEYNSSNRSESRQNNFERENNDLLVDERYAGQKMFASLTGQKLYEQLTNPTVKTQMLALYFYKKCEVWSQQIMATQPFIAITKRGVGSTVAEAKESVKKLHEILDPDAEHALALGGHLKFTALGQQAERMEHLYRPFFSKMFLNASEAYTRQENFAMQLINAANYDRVKISKEFFAEFKEFLSTNVKSKLYDHYGTNGTGSKTIKEIRETMLLDSKDNTSLAAYLSELKTKSEYESLFRENALLSSFTFNLCSEFDDNGRGLNFSTIDFRLGSRNDIDESDLYHAIDQLMAINLPLPSWNDEEYNTRLLAADLIAYTYLGRMNGARSFMKYIPMKYLVSSQYDTYMTSIAELPDASISQTFLRFDNLSNGAFISANVTLKDVPQMLIQFMQHHPEYAKYSRLESKGDGTYTIKKDFMMSTRNEDGTYPLFLYTNDKKGVRLFGRIHTEGTESVYTELNLLGNNLVHEYDANFDRSSTEGKILPSSLKSNDIDSRRVVQDTFALQTIDRFTEARRRNADTRKTGGRNKSGNKILNIKQAKVNNGVVSTNGTVSLYDVVNSFLENTDITSRDSKKVDRILAYFKFLKDNADKLGLKDVKIYGVPFNTVDKITRGLAKGVSSADADGTYDPSTNSIILNTEADNKFFGVDQEGNFYLKRDQYGLEEADGLNIILHEITHAITMSQIKNKFEKNSDGTYRVKVDNTDPLYYPLSKLISAYNTALKNANKFTDGSVLGGNNYGLTDPYEFISEALSNEFFREKLSHIKSEYSNQSLWDKIKSAFASIFEALGVKKFDEDGNITLEYDAVTASMEIINHRLNKADSMVGQLARDNAVDQTLNTDVNSDGEEIATLNHLTKSGRKTADAWFDKRRSDLAVAQRESFYAQIDDLPNNEGLAVANWYSRGTVRLPDDFEKIQQALKVAKIAKVDPMRYKGPVELMEAHQEIVLKDPPIDPHKVPTLHLVKSFPEQGLEIFDVDDSEISRENMRYVVDTHFGEQANPWCLLQVDADGNLTDNSEEMWYDRYNTVQKQAAFQNGKLVAFNGSSNGRDTWWDRSDTGADGIPIEEDVPDKDGVRGIRVFDTKKGSFEDDYMYTYRGNRNNGTYESWYDNGNRKEIAHYKDGKQVGEYRRYESSGEMSMLAHFKDGLPDGIMETYYYHRFDEDPSENILRSRFNFKDGKRVGTQQYFDLYTGQEYKHEEYSMDGKEVLDGLYFYYEGNDPNNDYHEEHYTYGVRDGKEIIRGLYDTVENNYDYGELTETRSTVTFGHSTYDDPEYVEYKLAERVMTYDNRKANGQKASYIDRDYLYNDRTHGHDRLVVKYAIDTYADGQITKKEIYETTINGKHDMYTRLTDAKTYPTTRFDSDYIEQLEDLFGCN